MRFSQTVKDGWRGGSKRELPFPNLRTRFEFSRRTMDPPQDQLPSSFAQSSPPVEVTKQEVSLSTTPFQSLCGSCLKGDRMLLSCQECDVMQCETCRGENQQLCALCAKARNTRGAPVTCSYCPHSAPFLACTLKDESTTCHVYCQNLTLTEVGECGICRL